MKKNNHLPTSFFADLGSESRSFTPSKLALNLLYELDIKEFTKNEIKNLSAPGGHLY